MKLTLCVRIFQCLSILSVGYLPSKLLEVSHSRKTILLLRDAKGSGPRAGGTESSLHLYSAGRLLSLTPTSLPALLAAMGERSLSLTCQLPLGNTCISTAPTERFSGVRVKTVQI